MTTSRLSPQDRKTTLEAEIKYGARRRDELIEQFNNGEQPLQNAISYIIDQELKAGAVPAVRRSHSRDINHLREDLEASLRFALGEAYEPNGFEVETIMGKLVSFDESQVALCEVQIRLGNAAFGQVTLYHLDNQTSLAGWSESLTRTSALVSLGMTVADLGWPNEELHPRYKA